MYINSSGRVGIGTTSPSYKLSVEGDIKINHANAANNYYLWLNKKSGQDGGILLQQDNSLEWQILNSGSSGDLKFYSYGTSSMVMTLEKSTGNVGIGTTSPAGNLHVVGASGGSGTVYISDADNGSGAADSLILQQGATNSYIWNKDSGFLSLGANNAERMRITSGGDVGIGTTAPHNETNYKTLTISDGTGGALRLKNNANTVAYEMRAEGAILKFGSKLIIQFLFKLTTQKDGVLNQTEIYFILKVTLLCQVVLHLLFFQTQQKQNVE